MSGYLWHRIEQAGDRRVECPLRVPDSQIVYAAGLPLTIVPLDSTTYVTLSDEERKQVSSHDSPLTFSLECLYRLWLSGQCSYDSPRSIGRSGRRRAWTVLERRRRFR